MKRFLLGAVVVVIGLGSAAMSHAATSNLVYQLLLSGVTGVSQGTGPGGVPKILTAPVTANNIINLARGRSPTAKVLPSEVLAVAVNGFVGAWNFKIMVYDPTAQVNLVTVADVPWTDRATSGATRTIVTSLLDVQDTGGTSNKLASGTLLLSGATSVKFIPTGPQDTRFTLGGSLHGAIDVTMNGIPTTLQITAGHVATKNKAIGIVVMP